MKAIGTERILHRTRSWDIATNWWLWLAWRYVLSLDYGRRIFRREHI
jgi:hypothetical protein